MRTVSSHFLLLSFLFIEGTPSACVPKCELMKVREGLVPSSFNKCVCEVQLEQAVSKSADSDNLDERLKCFATYRSLKFRNIETGVVVLHKAVVRTCSGIRTKEYVNQSIFDKEERDFLIGRNFYKTPAELSAATSKGSWVDGIRNSIMQLYRKPDSHLRFG